MRRLALARVFLHDGPIWLLDEPTEGLDVATAQTIIDEIFQRSQGKTVIWITHKPAGIVELMERVVRM